MTLSNKFVEATFVSTPHGHRSIKMKTLPAIFILLFASGFAHLLAQDAVDTKQPRWKQLCQAYGFVLGQESTLELIEKKFPDLTTATKEAWFAFNSTALGECVKGVEDELSKDLGEKWPEYKKMMADQMSDLTNKQEFTRQQASEFLAEVRKRAKGNIPESIRMSLLSAHPRYSKSPGLEIADGWKQTFRTKGHAKAKGVDVSISLPASWSKREGNRPNIVQVFHSGAGHGPIMCNLIIGTLPLPAGYKPTSAELKEYFQPAELRARLPEGASFIDAKEIVLEGSPAGMLVFDQTGQRLDIKFKMRMTQFEIIHGTSMVGLQFAIADIPGSASSLDDLQKQFLPTFKMIANSYVCNDRYK
jgi:hypothetical protein